MKTIIKSIIFFSCFFSFLILDKTINAADPIGQWTSTINLPFPLANHPSNNFYDKLFVFGGSTSFVRPDTISSSILPDGSLLSWETTTSVQLPLSLFWHSSISNENFVYILGGTTYSPENSVNNVFRGSYNSVNGISDWIEMTPLPKKLSGGSAVLVGNTIYYSGGGTWSGGWGGVTISNVVYSNLIDSSNNLGDWQIAGYMPSSTLQHILIYTGKKLIIIGGTNNTSDYSPSNKIYSADINSDGTISGWTELISLNISNRYPMINIFGNLVVLAGGWTNSGPTNNVYYSVIDQNGNTGDWILSDSKLPSKNCCTGSTQWHDNMYITGGHDGSSYFDSVWYSKINFSSVDPTPTPTPIPSPTPTPTLTPTPTSTPTLTPSPSPQIPVVFLPGLGGCLNFKEMFLGINNPNGWKITPGNNVYNNLLKTFEGKDYFYTYCYDWRKPVMENAQKLNTFIKDIVQPQESKVNLIGHSLGGLVSRTCVQKTENNCYVNKLITVGSPHFGAVDSYPAIEGGEIWRKGPIKLGYELFLRFNQLPGETRRKTLERIAPVLKDLLPSFDYLSKDNQNLSPGDLFYKNTLLPQLLDFSSLENKTNTISGRGFDSVERINLKKAGFVDELLGNWIDGKPVNNEITQEGDNSVLVKSASFNNPNIQNFTYELDHGGIVYDNLPLKKIIDIFGLDILPKEASTINDEENFLVFVVHSPVKISLKDLPVDSYFDDNLIVVPGPENKNYQLTIEGIGFGKYVLSVGQIYQDQVFWSDYAGSIFLGEKRIYNFLVDKETPKENPLIDHNNRLLNDSIKSLIHNLKKQINNLKLISKNKKVILNKLSGINQKNHEETLVKLSLFRMTVAQFEKEKQISKVEAEELRDTCMKLAKNLEYAVFSKTRNFPKKQAEIILRQSEYIKKNTEKKLTINSAFVFSQAVEYLQKAKDSFDSGNYFQTKIYSLEATGLFNEAKILSYP